MPIYAYRCTACGHAKDVLQKMSDPVLTQCTSCGAEAFVKQVTAAGCQLKGSGWYVTDFRGDSKSGKAPDGVVSPDAGKGEGEGAGGESSAAAAPAAKNESGSTAPAAAPAPTAAPAAAAPASAPSGGAAAASK